MSEPKKYPYIDAMRAIAVIMVIAVHCGQKVPASEWTSKIFSFGQNGVQLFFFASALTLCMSASARLQEPNPLFRFYARRFFRIAPLYYFGIAFYAAWSTVTYKYEVGPFFTFDQYTAKNILTNVLFIHGFYYPANTNIVPGGWSIGTEMAFYAIFPFLFKLISNVKNKQYILLASIGITMVTLPLIQAAIAIDMANNSFVYYNIMTQINVFIVGMIYFWESQDGPVWERPLIMTALFATISVIAWNQGRFYFVPLFFAITFIGVAELLKSAPAKVISLLQPIGQYSFSMYLSHFFVFSVVYFLFIKKLQPQRYIGADVTLLMYFIICVFITYFSAKALYKFVEKPMVDVGRRFILQTSQTSSVVNN